jgi:hypothetical protein
VKEDKGAYMQWRKVKDYACNAVARRERSMHAAREEKEACMQSKMREEHAWSEGWERSMHAVKEEKEACMQ